MSHAGHNRRRRRSLVGFVGPKERAMYAAHLEHLLAGLPQAAARPVPPPAPKALRHRTDQPSPKPIAPIVSLPVAARSFHTALSATNTPTTSMPSPAARKRRKNNIANPGSARSPLRVLSPGDNNGVNNSKAGKVGADAQVESLLGVTDVPSWMGQLVRDMMRQTPEPIPAPPAYSSDAGMVPVPPSVIPPPPAYSSDAGMIPVPPSVHHNINTGGSLSSPSTQGSDTDPEWRKGRSGGGFGVKGGAPRGRAAISKKEQAKLDQRGGWPMGERGGGSSGGRGSWWGVKRGVDEARGKFYACTQPSIVNTIASSTARKPSTANHRICAVLLELAFLHSLSDGKGGWADDDAGTREALLHACWRLAHHITPIADAADAADRVERQAAAVSPSSSSSSSASAATAATAAIAAAVPTTSPAALRRILEVEVFNHFKGMHTDDRGKMQPVLNWISDLALTGTSKKELKR